MAAMLVVAACSSSTKPSPVALLQDALAAQAKGHVVAAVSKFATDATVTGGDCTPSPCVGIDDIRRRVIESDVAQKITGKVLDSRVSGDSATGTIEFRSPKFPPTVQRVLAKFTATRRVGKLVALVVDFETSDPQTAQFLQAAGTGP
jgi:hypothetical protein